MTTKIDRLQMMTWFSLVVAFLALMLSAATFNILASRENVTVPTLIKEELQEGSETKALNDAKDKLTKLRAGVTSGARGIDPARELTQIREDLRNAMTKTGTEAKGATATLNSELAAIQERLRIGAVNATAAIDQMLASIEKALQTKK